MTSTRPLSRHLALATLATLLFTGPAPAAQDLTVATAREDLFVLQQGRIETRMTPCQGTSPSASEEAKLPGSTVPATRTRQLLEAMLPELQAQEAADVESLQDGYGTGGSGSSEPPGGPAGATRFLRFLENGMQQAYGKTHQDGWNILHTHVKNALSAGTGSLPPALVFAIETGKQASYEKSWKSAWEILHTTVKTVVEQPEPFMAGPDQAFPALLRLGRLCAYDKSFEDGWKALHTFTKALDSRRDLVPDDLHHLTLRLLREGSYERNWEHAWKWLEQGTKRIEKGVPNAGHFFEVALEAKANMSFESAWKGMHVMLKGVRDRKDLFPNEISHRALRATLDASYEKDWESAYEVLRDGTDRLRQALNSPADFFQLALKASGDKSYQHGWDILRDFATEALAGSFMNEFQRMQVKSSLEASYGRSWQSAYEVLRDGLRQASDL